MTAATRELHGLAIRSTVPLDGAEVDRAPDWRCSLGAPREVDGPPPGRLLGELHIGDLRYWSAADPARPHRWVLHHGRTAETVLDLEGRTITLHPDPRADPGLPPLLLGGSGVAHALAADGVSALHASAVEVDGSAVAFIGVSGQGKSTIAGLLCASGYRAVADDILRCEVAADSSGAGAAYCYRGSTRLRLRPQAAELAPLVAADPHETADERVGVLAQPTPLRRLPLAAIVAPRPSRDATRLSVERLRGRRAAAELLRAPRLIGWLEPSLIRLHFELTEGLVNAVPVLEATIPWGPPFPLGLAGELVGGIMSAA